MVHPVKPGTIRVVVYDSKGGDTILSNRVKKLTPGKPYYVQVGEDGIWQEIFNVGRPIFFDKDEPLR